MQILIPISTRSQFFPTTEYFFPKPLINVAGKPMIEQVGLPLRNKFPKATFIFVLDYEDAVSFSLDKLLCLLFGAGTKIVYKQNETMGALCSCLLAADVMVYDQPLVIANSDVIISADAINKMDLFVHGQCDAGVLTFESVHPKWSYVTIDDNNCVTQTAEKNVISKRAIAGLYYYKTAELFINSAFQVLRDDVRVKNQYFVSSTLNQIILDQGSVHYSDTNFKNVVSLSNPKAITEYESSLKMNECQRTADDNCAINIVIPAAGLGSRFSREGWKKPKPFIDLNGKPMIVSVIKNLIISGAQFHIILNAEHKKYSELIHENLEAHDIKIHFVETTTEGTACTVLSIKEEIDNDKPLLIANSDQLVECNLENFVNNCRSRSLDGSIMVFNEPTLDPKWSYARVDAQYIVTEVAEKTPISEFATVGIYLFERGRDFVDYAVKMIVANERVNNEFYTCPVYNYGINKGASFGIYEISRSDMHGLGTPDDFKAYVDKKSLPQSVDIP